MKLDILSDLHIDMWVSITNPHDKQKRLIKKLISEMLPDSPSKTIIMAGDIGHYNLQNKALLSILKGFYENVIWVHGNHDLYMISDKMTKKYKHDSFRRLSEMINMSEDVGAVYLDGDTVTIDGITIGGGAAWYDGKLATIGLNYDKANVIDTWTYTMNDARLILDKGAVLDFMAYAELENKKVHDIAHKSDVMVTHICPQWNDRYISPITATDAFYAFDGNQLIKDMADRKTWIYGHTHEKKTYTKDGIRFYTNALGYPGENYEDGKWKKAILTIDTEEKDTYT
jgi:predicted phosphodiesterase